MWIIIQHRWIRNSDQNNQPNVVGSYGRFREARGQAKAHLNSHLKVVTEHEHFPLADLEIVADKETLEFWAEWSDLDGPLYRIQYEVKDAGS